jgi:DNA-binding NarL/FixJ family response regulator
VATRVLVGVDAPIIRAGLEHTLTTAPGIDVVGWASHPLGMVEQVGAVAPDVLACFFGDLRPACDVADAVPGLPVLCVCERQRDEDVVEGLRCGLRGLLPRTATVDTLVETLRLLAAGQLVYPPGWERVLIERMPPPRSQPTPSATTTATLTPRETDVLSLLLAGWSVKQVAARLGIALQTTKNHIHHLMVKTGSASREEVYAWAQQHGISAARGSPGDAPPGGREHGRSGQDHESLSAR